MRRQGRYIAIIKTYTVGFNNIQATTRNVEAEKVGVVATSPGPVHLTTSET